jgi:hypothetical protein
MPDVTVWWLPDARTEWVFVARGKRGICYSVPRVPNGWLVRVAWPAGECPNCEPLPERIGLIVGGLVRLPGCAMPSPRETAEVGEWLAAARQTSDVQAARDAAGDLPMPDPEAPKPRRLNFGVPAEVLS